MSQATRSRQKKYGDRSNSVGSQDGVQSQGKYKAVKRRMFGDWRQEERVRGRSQDGTPQKEKQKISANKWQGGEAGFYHAALSPELTRNLNRHKWGVQDVMKDIEARMTEREKGDRSSSGSRKCGRISATLKPTWRRLSRCTVSGCVQEQGRRAAG